MKYMITARPIPLLACLLCVIAVLPVAAQTDYLLDFGTSTQLSGVTLPWNDIHSGNMSQATALVAATGAPTTAALAFVPGQIFAGGNAAGTTTPVPGSPLAALGFPNSATGDYLYGSNSYPLVEFVLSGLDVSATHDLTFVASRMNVSDNRTTSYTVIGANIASVTLDPANNQSAVAMVPGITPAPGGLVTVQVAAAPANTNSAGFFYLNALKISAGPGGPTAPFLGFIPGAVTATLLTTAPPLPQVVTPLTSDGGTPSVTLSAIDSVTQTAPSWLALPASVVAGQAVSLLLDPAGLAVGSYGAVVSGTAPGYLPTTMLVTMDVVAPTPGSKLLFYGNSFSMGNQGTPSLVGLIAEEAGLPAPKIVERLAGGTNLNYHLTSQWHAGAITAALPWGEHWDFVVLQGHSLEATTTLGNPTAFRANAVQIHQNVVNHSPGAKAVMFQTWARAPGHAFYTGSPPTYPDPYAMHAEIRVGYQQAVADIVAAQGPGAGRLAPVGDAFADEGFPLAWYASDLYHQGPRGTLVSAMVMVTAIYHQHVGCIEPDFAGGSPLATRLTALGLTLQDWQAIADVADRLAPPQAAPYPGSGADLRLSAAVDGVQAWCPIKEVLSGQTVDLAVTSPGGSFTGAWTLLLGQALPPGGLPNLLPGLPEVHLDPLAIGTLIPASPLSGPLTFTATLPLSPALYLDLRIQGVALAPNPGNPAFTTTDAHLLELR